MPKVPTAHELVERGARLLDEKLPGWADQIDLDTLNMREGCNCIIGQIGGRRFNLDALGWHNDVDAAHYSNLIGPMGIVGYEYGFDSSADRDDFHVFYDDLQDAWKGEIVARRTLDAL